MNRHPVSNPANQGNAIVAALGVVVVVAGVLLVSSTNATQILKDQDYQMRQSKALAALEAVISRRESMLSTLANEGTLVAWDGLDPRNFGMDVIGSCRVRWRIEPARTVRDEDLGLSTQTMKYMANPSPDNGYKPSDSREVVNGFTYLYRVAAEAELPAEANIAPAYAQGARYVAVNGRPTFRYVINYLRKGPAGDLEFSHNPAVNIRGNVNSNGAIYIGSGVQVNDWASVAGGSGNTAIGPDANGKSVIVNAMDGIFRLSKPTVYGGLNGFPLANGGSISSPESRMDVTGSYPGDQANIVAGSFAGVTLGGRAINPYRLNDTSGFVTQGTALRTINGVSISGVGANPNDSRDKDRASTASKFKATSPGSAPLGFSGYVRTGETNGQYELVPKVFNRAFEPEAITYRDTDGDPVTDDHDFAIPQFYNPAATGDQPKIIYDPSISANGAAAKGNLRQILEVPGYYLRQQIGDRAMARIANDPLKPNGDGSGWVVTDKDGKPIIPGSTDAEVTGLSIRERQIPDTDLWPGTTDATRFIKLSDPDSLPFALGKHWRPVTNPFTPIDVSQDLSNENNDAAWANINHNPLDRSATTLTRSVNYRFQGQLQLIGANGVPADNKEYMAADFSSGTQAADPNPYIRRLKYHTDTWRFVHLKNRYGLTDAQILTQPQGLRYYYWNKDFFQNNGDRPIGSSGEDVRQPFLGTPTATGVDQVIDNPLPWLPAAQPATVTGNASDYFSVRWDGFLVPPDSGMYYLGLTVDDGFRLWVDDRLVAERWSYNGAQFITPGIFMAKSRPVKIVLEMYEVGGGEGVNLQWSTSPSSGFGLIPTSAMRAAPALPGFDRSKFTSMTTRIDAGSTMSCPVNGKIGLMLRPAFGEADMLSGRDRYVFFGYNPQRGVFIERRMEPARSYNRTSANPNFYIGTGTFTLNGGPSTTAPLGVLQTGGATSGTYATVVTTVTRNAQIQCTVGAVTTGAVSSTTEYLNVGSYTKSPTTGTANLGDGVTVSVKTGNYLWAGNRQARNVKKRNAQRTYTWNFLTSGAGFPTSLIGANRPAISIYQDGATTTTTTSVEYTLGADSYNKVNDTTLTIGQSEDVSSAGSYVASADFNVGDDAANTVWKPFPGGYSGAQTVSELNRISYKGITNWRLGNGTGDFPAFPTPALTPTDPSDPTAATLGTWYDTAVHSFSMNVTPNYRIKTDTNPWVSRNGTWGIAPGQLLVRPWSSTWSNVIFNITPPQTLSYRPDLWNVFGTVPLLVPALTEASTANASAATSTVPPAMADDVAVPSPAGSSVWLRVVQTDSTANTFAFQYAVGAATPATTGWTTVTTAEAVNLAGTNWASFLAGPAIQSGDVNSPITVNLDNLSVTTSESIGNSDGVWNYLDWDATQSLAGSGSPMSRYLASQYQVFYGTSDITQDFMSWGDQTGGTPIVSEEWFYNPREFWSQNNSWRVWDPAAAFRTTEQWGAPSGVSRWNPFYGWVNVAHKETTPLGAPTDEWSNLTYRTSWAKTTLLSIDLKRLWSYLSSRSYAQARTKVMEGATVPAFGSAALSATFNGLIYAARTNRYPFNPNQPLTDPSIDPDSDGNAGNGWTADPAKIGGVNPWSPNVRASTFAAIQEMEYPNGWIGNAGNPKSVSNNNFALSVDSISAASTWNSPQMYCQGVHKLQPYPEITVYPIRPQEFHHGVRIYNGKNINWGIVPGVSKFGAGATSIVTPNALYIQGDFNKDTNSVMVDAVTAKDKVTPVAVMADSITLWSNSFSLANAKQMRISATANNFSGWGFLVDPTVYATASDTTYNMGIVTHNQPTTQARVLEGQSAPFVDTMLFMENWTGKTMNYLGSLVVLDTRRYTDAFLLDGYKTAGRSPFGYLGWVATIPPSQSGPGLAAASSWIGTIPKIYSAPTRNMDFQTDFLSREGTPPFVPFGMTTNGVGGWTRVGQ